MAEWTQERIQEFWERCGVNTVLPDITDLDALFKYAVPILYGKFPTLSGIIFLCCPSMPLDWCHLEFDDVSTVGAMSFREGNYPALALAEAIEKAMEEKE